MEETFNVGDKVVPIEPININGKTLKQYDSEYIITQIIDDQAILMSKGQIWGTFYLSNLKHIK